MLDIELVFVDGSGGCPTWSSTQVVGYYVNYEATDTAGLRIFEDTYWESPIFYTYMYTLWDDGVLSYWNSGIYGEPPNSYHFDVGGYLRY